MLATAPPRPQRRPGQRPADLTATGLARLLDADATLSARLRQHMGWSSARLSNIKSGLRGVNTPDAERVAALVGQPIPELFAPRLTGPAETYPEIDALPLVLTMKEVADILRVSLDSVRDRCMAGSIHSIELGNRRRIPRAELRRILAAS